MIEPGISVNRLSTKKKFSYKRGHFLLFATLRTITFSAKTTMAFLGFF